MAGWIDSHAHLEVFARKGELDPVLERAREAGVERVVTIGTRPGDWELYRRIAAERSSFVAFTAGLHPCDVDEGWEETVRALGKFLDGGAVPAAVGETGLDRFHLPKDQNAARAAFERQEAAFRAHIDLAARRELPLVVHSRGAFADCVQMLDASGFDWSRVVFHCFADGPEEIRELNSRGGRASFTGIITYKSAEKVREAVRAQGPDLLMLETDAPYLAPVPHRGKRNEPAFVRHTAACAAEVLGIDEARLAGITSANAKRFYGLED